MTRRWRWRRARKCEWRTARHAAAASQGVGTERNLCALSPKRDCGRVFWRVDQQSLRSVCGVVASE
eukprot:3367941-Prymnesium_polylepis.1